MLLTVGEITKKYGVTRRAVNYQISVGNIKCQWIGNIRCIEEEDVPETWKNGLKGRWADDKMKLERERNV